MENREILENVSYDCYAPTDLMIHGDSILMPAMKRVMVNYLLAPRLNDEDAYLQSIMNDLEVFKKLNSLRNLGQIKWNQTFPFFKKILSLSCRGSPFRVKLLKAILERENETLGFSINQRNHKNNQRTELMDYVAESNAEQPMLFLEHFGCNPFLADYRKANALHLIIIKGRKERGENFSDMAPVFHKILKHSDFREHANDQTVYGHTALHLACLRRDVDYIVPLLEAKADAGILDCDGKTALELAELSNTDRLLLLMNYVISENENDIDVLIRAVRNSKKFQEDAANKHVTEILIKKKTDKSFRACYYRLLKEGLKSELSVDERIFSSDVEDLPFHKTEEHSPKKKFKNSK